MGGDVGEEVQRLVLKFMELVMSDSEEGVEKETRRWGWDVVVEEGRRRGDTWSRGRRLLTRVVEASTLAW